MYLPRNFLRLARILSSSLSSFLLFHFTYHLFHVLFHIYLVSPNYGYFEPFTFLLDNISEHVLHFLRTCRVEDWWYWIFTTYSSSIFKISSLIKKHNSFAYLYLEKRYIVMRKTYWICLLLSTIVLSQNLKFGVNF